MLLPHNFRPFFVLLSNLPRLAALTRRCHRNVEIGTPLVQSETSNFVECTIIIEKCDHLFGILEENQFEQNVICSGLGDGCTILNLERMKTIYLGNSSHKYPRSSRGPFYCR